MKSTIPLQSTAEQDVRSPEASEQPARLHVKGYNPHPYSRSRPDAPAARAAWQVVPASPGDHPLIHQFLLSIFHKPTPGEFQAQLEEPHYEPADRLLIKSGSQIVAHARLLHREMHFGSQIVPVGIVVDLATLPEFRGRGCASALLAAARHTLAQQGAELGLLATDQPHFYMRRGWVVSGRHCYSTAAPREILAHLRQREAEAAQLCTNVLKPQAHKRYNIRLWRRVELAALMRLYEENSEQRHGSLVRTAAYWRWLVSRNRKLHIYVAIDGPDKLELDDSLTPIVGYAAVHEGRIVELMTSAQHPEAGEQLLMRVCADAIEKDYLRVRLDAPHTEPLHALLTQAGGACCHHEADQGMVFMASILRPRHFLRLIGREFGERVKGAGSLQPCQLGLLIQNDKYRLVVSRHKLELVEGTVGRSYLKCSHYDFNQLLLGHLDVRQAQASGRLTVSTHVALEVAALLFPRLSFWRPPWDEVPAE